MMAAVTAAVVLQWILILGLSAMTVALMRQVGVLHERLGPVGALTLQGGPAVGTAAPAFELPALDGRSVTIGDAARGRSILIFFLSPQCPVCKSMLPLLKATARERGPSLQIILASDGEPDAQRRMVAEHRLTEFPLVLSSALGLAFQVSKLPHAVLIDSNNQIAAKGLINNREHLESLFEAHERGVGSLQEFNRQQALRLPATRTQNNV